MPSFSVEGFNRSFGSPFWEARKSWHSRQSHDIWGHFQKLVWKLLTIWNFIKKLKSKRNFKQIISVLFRQLELTNIYIESGGGALKKEGPNTKHRVSNFRIKNGRKLKVEDKFLSTERKISISIIKKFTDTLLKLESYYKNLGKMKIERVFFMWLHLILNFVK